MRICCFIDGYGVYRFGLGCFGVLGGGFYDMPLFFGFFLIGYAIS